MSTQAATPTIEDSIKTALDAADTAITVTREFDQVRNDYAKTRVEVKAINRQVMIVFISSLVASVLAVAAAGMIYFRTISEMQTTNATSLEALVIFAENVDRLAAATTEANSHAEKIAGLGDGIEAIKVMMGDIITRLDTQSETTQAEFANVQSVITGIVGQTSLATIEDLSAAIAAGQNELATQIETLRTASEPGTDEGASPFDAISATLETMMMLQREISAKITVASTPPRAPARTAPPPPTQRAAPVDNDMIKFP